MKAVVTDPSDASHLDTALRDAARAAASSAASVCFSVGAGISLCTLRFDDPVGEGRRCATISRIAGDRGSQAFMTASSAVFRSALLRSFSATSTLRDAAIAARSFPPSGGYPCLSASATLYSFQMGSRTHCTNRGLSFPPAAFLPTIFRVLGL